MQEITIELKELPRLRPDAFARDDEGPDPDFYRAGRRSPPLDALALHTVEDLLSSLITDEGRDVLDLMAGADSHLPEGLAPRRVVGLGVDEAALEANTALDDRVVHDLNADPRLPFPDASFDVVLNSFSVEYLVHPLEVLAEAGRVLRPGGLLVVVFTNRKIKRKVVRVWESLTERRRHRLVEEMVTVCGSFVHVERFRSVGLPRPADDPFVDLGLPSDPVYAVVAENIRGATAGPTYRCPPSVTGLDIDAEALDRRKRAVGDTHVCPYCEQDLTPWEVPFTPFSEWTTEHFYVCLNNRCPYYCRSWSAMDDQGNRGYGYRLMYNPDLDRCMPTPAAGLRALKDDQVVPRG